MRTCGYITTDVWPSCVMCGRKKFYRGSSVGFVFVVLLYLDFIHGFNLDVEFPDVRIGEPGSMFGYSVAQHIDQNEGWLYIGAPSAQTSQPGIVKGGAVYRCRANVTNAPCEFVPFDVKGNADQYNGTYYIHIEDKSYQWFGATVQSSGRDGYILACAPRYVYKSADFDKRAPVGTCYLARSQSKSFQEFSPCRISVDLWRNTVDQHNKRGSCLAGFSISLSKSGERLLIGAPGAYYWQGQVFNIYLDNGNEEVSTKEGPLSADNSYRGYSSAVGRFDADSEDDYVVGVPRGEQLLGKVELYTQNMTNIKKIVGKQIGAYFGYAVAVQDLDGNNLDDIIVGAPLYSDYSSTESYDSGRVYIYYQTNKGEFDSPETDLRKFRPNKRYDILEGFEPKSRFGTALIGLSDINVDNYRDLAVGAPYGGKDKKGVVYVYLGSEKGIITKVAQIIEGAEMAVRISSFGFALSGGHDLDNNEYPDLLVGAYETNTAVYLKARPIVRVAASLKIEPSKISLEEQNCKLPWNNQDVPCITIFTCVKYDGIGVPDTQNFDFKWKFDTLKNNSKRVYYLNTNLPDIEDDNIRLQKTVTWCQTYFVYIRCSQSEVCDKLTPITVDFEFKLREDSRRRRRSIRPILDQYIPTLVQDTGHIEKECGDDDICIPDVYGTALTFAEKVILGKKDNIDILIQLDNRAEGAYECGLYIELPPGVVYDNIIHKKFVTPFYCDVESVQNNGNVTSKNMVICQLGNPFPRTTGKAESEGTTFTLTVTVTPEIFNVSLENLKFKFLINSSNPELNSTLDDNKFSVSVPVVQYADLDITSGEKGSIPEQIVYNETGVSLYKDSGKGPSLTHIYVVTNLGYSDIAASEVNIYWPSYDDFGNNLLYLTDPVQIIGNDDAYCQLYPITPQNSTIWYSEKDKKGENVDVVVQQHHTLRRKRQTSSGSRVTRDTTRKIVCNKQWCTLIRCNLGYIRGQSPVTIKISARIWTDTLIKSGLTSEPYMLTSQALVKVRKMPYKIKVDNSTYKIRSHSIGTYLNAEKLAPRPKGVEPWVIAVAISAGLLLLLLLIVLLWWCGFFRRKRPAEEQPFNKPLITNGANTKSITSRPYE